ncbi:hypothetical protein PsorP6_001825 [Peronosclerospora sorghi]|uniref:Uncharacterized protein n=1 Tax=Peronosclerospora sorghi TaxID=230839 RepID=A0ACC0WSA9_9STRA|nr:hypothetical protein PsorP6_001825 [Peronosclerospora sorghi]
MSRTPFQPAHELNYQVNRLGSMPVLCISERKTGESRARKQTNRIKTWESFRPELYESHHKGQHATHWSAYQALNHDAKKKFFDNVQPHANTLHSHFSSRDQPLSFVLRRGVIEVIIGDVFFNPDDHGSVSHQRVLALFVPEIGSDNSVQHYTVRIKNPLQFQLVTAHLSHGLSFRQVAAVLESSKLLLGVGKIGSISDDQVSNFTRILVAVNLTILHEILESPEVLGFSIALDSFTHRGVSYLSIRIRFHYKNLIHNIHVAAFPMSERHTAVNIYDLTVKVFNVLRPSWRKKVLRIASDGENVMTGRIRGVVTLLERDCLFPIHRTWCMLHQIDLVVKERVNNLFGGYFISIVNKIAHSLRKQENLIREMGSKCPKMTTRLLALGSWSQWQLQHYEQLNTFFSSPRPDQVRPPGWYWPIVSAVFALFETVNRTMRALQNRNLLMTQQRMEICSMIDRIKKTTEVEGPLTDEESRAKHDNDRICTIGTQKIARLKAISLRCFQVSCASCEAEISVHYLRDTENASRQILHQICSEKTELFKACENDNALQQAIQQSSDQDSSEEQWNINALDGRFTSLRSFAGALFTVFPNTSSIENDFSVLGWEKNENRESLSNISLEDVLQATQFDQLQQLKQI